MTGWLDDVAAAARLLTRLPLPERPGADFGRAVRAYPVIGALIGVAGAGALLAARRASVPPIAAELIAVGIVAALTGGLHEDGLADCCDGFGGGRDRATKLTIMRDSRIGSFGALALILSVGVRAAALAALPNALVLPALVAAHAGSRALLAAVVGLLPPARADGMGAALGRLPVPVQATAGGLGLLLVIGPLGWPDGARAAVAGSLAGLAAAAWAWRQIRGFTGDVLGLVQQVAEAAVLTAVGAGVGP